MRAPRRICARTPSRPVAAWWVDDVVCTSGPHDRPFEERHPVQRVALVGAGTFTCCGPAGHELMVPGSLLLGNAGESFECGHAHGAGDRCLSFAYDPEHFGRVAADAGAHPRFKALRVPPVRELASLAAHAHAAWSGPKRADAAVAWDELAIRFAASAAQMNGPARRPRRAPRNAERGVAAAIRLIEHDPAAELGLATLAKTAHLSAYHFLRVFARVAGVTPHRYVVGARLRRAAAGLIAADRPIIQVALEHGFGDVSSFNRAFRAAHGMAPRAFRARYSRHARA